MHIPPRGSGHLEEPRRLDRAVAAIKRSGLLGRLEKVEPGFGSLRVFEEVHDPLYIRGLLSELEASLDSYFIDSDTYISPGTQAALEALASAVEEASEHVVEGGKALVLGRPPGHHAGVAGPGLGAPSLGGSLVNAAAAIAYRLAKRGLKVLIVDFDANHGNGTQEILQALPMGERIFHLDIHQDWRKSFPWTGEPGVTGDGAALNIVLPEGSGDDIMLALLEGLEPMIRDSAPDALVASMGFDGYTGDSPLTLTKLTANTYYSLGRLASGYPVAAVLETGFGRGLEQGLPAFVAGLLGLGNPAGEEATESSVEVWREFLELNKEVVEAG
ncbi:deacetylase [Aeropyrum camini SY1 = JCM 12091]|uniref:Deacetylase n=3 Tax=Aeropyrum camini TaxID=229980 RepID=U3TE22_9CREN|nr:deacetylase [Aeropyrum camini SY1 = JCM 12091]